MGNESGEWIMHGMNWDNPDCIHSVDEAIKYINEFGFLPLFKNDIDGFSLEERTVPEYWWSDNPEIDPWMWRAIIARRHDMYSMSVSKFMQLAKDAKACYKVNQLVLVNLDIIDEYLETFHIVDDEFYK